MATKFNPHTKKPDIVGVIPQVSGDPSSPSPEDAWIKKTGGGGGEAYGILLTLTQPGSAVSYELSYRTLENTTIRVSLT